MFKLCKFSVGLYISLAIAFTASAFALEKPNEKVILSFSGQITNTNSPNGTASFDLSMLQQLPVRIIKTTTPWTDGEITFKGALLRDILDAIGAKGTELKASAVNDYSVTLPIKDIYEYDIIIAYEKDGALMTIREKGPLWIIYPWSEKPELKTEVHHSRSIWQLNQITVR